MNTSDPLPCSMRWCRYSVVICLLVQFILACDAGRQLTPTHDEYWHLPIGLLIWKTGRFDCDVINPPPLRLWASLPLVLDGARLDADERYTQPGEIGDLFWLTNPEHRMLWFALGRVMIAILNAATGWLLACWGRRWFGEIVGLAVAVLWCGCPNILAHGSLVTHDAAATFGFVSTVYAIVLWSGHPSWKRAAIAGICLGVAQVLKVTCILLFPLAVIIWLLVPIQPSVADNQRPNWKARIGHWTLIFGLAIFVINVSYLGHGTCQTLASMKFGSQRFQQLQQNAWIGSWPIPVPRSYVLAFDRVAQDVQNAHPVFLDGEWNVKGFPTYYLEALACKLPLGTWFMLVITVLMLTSPAFQFLLRRRIRFTSKPNQAPIDWRKQGVLLIPFLSLFVPASLGGNQFGIRYVLPTLPFLYLFAAQAAIPLSDKGWHWQQWLVITALASQPFSLRYHPHHLAYFNEWAGGPDEGKNLLVDSNLDWGQDLHGLANYLREHKIDKIGLAYFGTVHPQSVGIQFELPPKGFPRPGNFAISANFLMGRPFLIRTPTVDGNPPVPKFDSSHELTGVVSTHDDEFGYLRFFEPQAIIGHSIYVYHLTDQDIARYRTALARFKSRGN